MLLKYALLPAYARSNCKITSLASLCFVPRRLFAVPPTAALLDIPKAVRDDVNHVAAAHASCVRKPHRARRGRRRRGMA